MRSPPPRKAVWKRISSEFPSAAMNLLLMPHTWSLRSPRTCVSPPCLLALLSHSPAPSRARSLSFPCSSLMWQLGLWLYLCRAHMHGAGAGWALALTFGSCWELHMVLVAGAATLPRKFKWLWPSVSFRAELWAGVSPDQRCFVFFVIYRCYGLPVEQSGCSPEPTASPGRASTSLSQPCSNHKGGLGQSLSPQQVFHILLLNVSICLYASFWLCLILWIDYFLLFWRNHGLSVCYLLLGFFRLWSFFIPFHFRVPSPHNSIPLN